MKTYSLQADLCKALAHPVRLHVLNLLSHREYSVEELTGLTGSGQSNLSQHLAALRQQKLVVSRRAGMNVYYGLSNPKIADACKLIRKLMVELSEEEHRVLKKGDV
jgi:DNA-binding transcriptional ArsR family regulator